MKEEVLRILKMVEDGKIDAEKATELIDALKEQKVEVQNTNYGDRMLKIKVKSEDGDDVNITLPIKFVKGMIGSMGKISLGGNSGIDKVDPQIINEAIDGNLVGKIVDIKTGDGEIIEIFIE
jgi:hypothetical protein